MSGFVRGGMARKSELDAISEGALIPGGWVNVIGIRAVGVTYVNTFGKPLVSQR